MEGMTTFRAGLFEAGVAGRAVQVIALDPLSTPRADLWFFYRLEKGLLFQGTFVRLGQRLSRA
jgi:hypothetical protein